MRKSCRIFTITNDETMTISTPSNYFELTSDSTLVNLIKRLTVKIQNNTATTEEVGRAIVAEAEAEERGLCLPPIVEIYTA